MEDKKLNARDIINKARDGFPIQHFETIWNNAEKIGEKLEDDHNFLQNLQAIEKQLDKFRRASTIEERNECYGEMLFNMCQISRKVPINSAALLLNVIDSKKAELLDPDETEDSST